MKPVAVFRHVPHEGPGLLGEVLSEAGLELQTHDMFRAPPAELDPATLAGLVIMGGPMNVEEIDQYPWLAPERVWIAEALEAGLPVLGHLPGLPAHGRGTRGHGAPRAAEGDRLAAR